MGHRVDCTSLVFPDVDRSTLDCELPKLSAAGAQAEKAHCAEVFMPMNRG